MIVKQKIQRSDGSVKYRNYEMKQKLGSGGFAQCYLAERMDDKKHYAMKIIPKKLLVKPKPKQKMISEIKLHRTIKHKNICQLQRAFEDDENVYMLLELCRNKNMFDLIKRRKKLTVPQTQYFIYQLIDALCYLHSRQIVHRDIKLGNLLIDQKMVLKLADFGLATKIQFLGDKKHTVCGTPNYIAPQIIMFSMGIGVSGHSYQVDVWSTGVILFLMLIGRAPFETAHVDRTYKRIVQGQFTFPESFKDQSAMDLLKKILTTDPSKRYTFQQILAHPFMNPKVGIPKQIPSSSMISAPKFGIFEKYAQQDVKRSARNVSISSIKSQMDISLGEDFQNVSNNLSAVSQTQRLNSRQNSFRDKSKEIRGLLRSVLSTSSLSKSLTKLNNLSRSNSPQVQRFSKQQSQSLISIDQSSKLSIKKQQKPILKKIEKPKQIYIVQYQKDIITTYLLSNGLIGSYQTQNPYKVIYNHPGKVFYQILNQKTIKKIPYEKSALNENIQNRLKFMERYIDKIRIQEAYQETQNLIYLNRIIQVKIQKLILFKLSNEDIQAYNYENNNTLLLGKQQLTLIEFQNGKQRSSISTKKQKYSECKNKTLIAMFLKVKKILQKLYSIGKE